MILTITNYKGEAIAFTELYRQEVEAEFSQNSQPDALPRTIGSNEQPQLHDNWLSVLDFIAQTLPEHEIERHSDHFTFSPIETNSTRQLRVFPVQHRNSPGGSARMLLPVLLHVF